MSLLTGEARSATVRARGDVQLFSISKESFSEILFTQPEIAELLARTLAKRQADTAEVLGRKQEGEERATPRILARIKSFFRLTCDEPSGSV
jgi:CRP-like cAMP-binding protein